MDDKWHVCAAPGSALTAIDPDPVPRADGATWQRFRTTHNVVFAKVIEASGLVIWMQRVTQ